MSTYEELKEKILKNYDPDMLCEILGITSESLVDRYEDQIIKNMSLFEEAMRKGAKMNLGQWCEKEGLAHFTMKSIDELLEHLKCLPTRN